MSDPAASVVLHVSYDAADVSRAVGSARLLVAADEVVRVIVNGPALEGVTAAASAVPAADGVTIEACRTGMRGRGIRVEDLQPGVGTVESAVVALAAAQHGGAAYIRI